MFARTLETAKGGPNSWEPYKFWSPQTAGCVHFGKVDSGRRWGRCCSSADMLVKTKIRALSCVFLCFLYFMLWCTTFTVFEKAVYWNWYTWLILIIFKTCLQCFEIENFSTNSWLLLQLSFSSISQFHFYSHSKKKKKTLPPSSSLIWLPPPTVDLHS